ncbi:hypothetical protein [Konateibacter massiliensis]|uniref:hypothetical protein n=1 Tax=Konateibacter massiliensis TaxID=2002841 RepID=UPI000C15FAE5|nr:hypothetical protein [Konateibacter massiliensis]
MESEINVLKRTKDTLRAFVDAVIPRSPGLVPKYGAVQYYGAVDFLVEEYLIVTLNEYVPNLAEAVAEMLNIAAQKLISRRENKENLILSESGIFASLAPNDRLLAIALLKKHQYTSSQLLSPFEAIYFNVTDNLVRMTIMGYYSEWFGYGTTRLLLPNDRELEFYPLSWEQVGYPGPRPPRPLRAVPPEGSVENESEF